MPDISIKRKYVRGKILFWIDLSVIDPFDKAYFLSIDMTLAYIDTKSLSIEELTRNVPAVKKDTVIKKFF